MINNREELKRAIVESNKDIAENIVPLDDEEKELFDIYRNSTINDIEIFDDDKSLKSFREAQEQFKKDNATTTIDVKVSILDKIKTKAEEQGMNYKTYIDLFLYQLANNKIKITIS